jgi:hypothetical protein
MKKKKNTAKQTNKQKSTQVDWFIKRNKERRNILNPLVIQYMPKSMIKLLKGSKFTPVSYLYVFQLTL